MSTTITVKNHSLCLPKISKQTPQWLKLLRNNQKSRDHRLSWTPGQSLATSESFMTSTTPPSSQCSECNTLIRAPKYWSTLQVQICSSQYTSSTQATFKQSKLSHSCLGHSRLCMGWSRTTFRSMGLVARATCLSEPYSRVSLWLCSAYNTKKKKLWPSGCFWSQTWVLLSQMSLSTHLWWSRQERILTVVQKTWMNFPGCVWQLVDFSGQLLLQFWRRGMSLTTVLCSRAAWAWS